MRARLAEGNTRRRESDFYPTPENATAVLRDWLVLQRMTATHLCDPAAGDGAIIHAMRERQEFAESHWHAIEIDAAHADALEEVAEAVTIADSLCETWQAAAIVVNPPFSQLDAFWLKAAHHRNTIGAWVAMFVPVAWWCAERRRDYTRPDFVLPLGWRPTFHPKEGPAHKGMQDFAWCVLDCLPRTTTVWERLEKPRDYEKENRTLRRVRRRREMREARANAQNGSAGRSTV